MAIYFVYSENISKRKSNYCFYCEKNNLILRNKKTVKRIDTSGSLFDSVHTYVKTNKIDNFEILISIQTEILESFEYFSKVLMLEDLSVGIVTSNYDLYQENISLAIQYGITVSYRRFIQLEDISSSRRYKAPRISFGFIACDFKETCSPRNSFTVEKRASIKSAIILEESFHDKLMKFIIESGKDNVEIYKKAGISRQVFSNIISNKDLIPTKLTLVSLCIGLELTIEDTNELMHSAGYSLSKSIMFDSIILKYIYNEVYDLDYINSELDEHGCQLLGWRPRDN